jgi:hypothetical protein
MLTSIHQLQYYMRFKHNFQGDFCNNNTPNTQFSDYSIIVNTDTCNLYGTHWIAIKVFRNIFALF